MTHFALSTHSALLTFSVYIGSSIYSPALIGPNSVSMVFDVSEISALTGLTLFVIGYAISPMLWSPMSEIPRIGRNPICECVCVQRENTL